MVFLIKQSTILGTKVFMLYNNRPSTRNIFLHRLNNISTIFETKTTQRTFIEILAIVLGLGLCEFHFGRHSWDRELLLLQINFFSFVALGHMNNVNNPFQFFFQVATTKRQQRVLINFYFECLVQQAGFPATTYFSLLSFCCCGLEKKLKWNEWFYCMSPTKKASENEEKNNNKFHFLHLKNKLISNER